MSSRRRGKITWTLGSSAATAVVLGLLLVAYLGREPVGEEETSAVDPRELYAAVSAHLAACRAENFPLAYHAAASAAQERLSAVQFERKLRADYGPLRRADHVEFGPARTLPDERDRAEVDVYFVLDQRGEIIVRRYELVREDGDWKVDRSAPVAGWGSGGARVRLTGRKV